MREDRRSEPGLANGRVEADRMQESIQALRPPSNPMLFVHPCCTNSGLGVPHETSHEMPLSSSSHNPRQDHKGNSMFCALRVHKFGPETQSRDPSRERLCGSESQGSRHLFAIARLCHRDKFRFVFAKCQAPFLSNRIGKQSSWPARIPITRDALHHCRR